MTPVFRKRASKCARIAKTQHRPSRRTRWLLCLPWTGSRLISSQHPSRPATVERSAEMCPAGGSRLLGVAGGRPRRRCHRRRGQSNLPARCCLAVGCKMALSQHQVSMWAPLSAQLLLQLLATALMLCFALLGVCQRMDPIITASNSANVFALRGCLTNTLVANIFRSLAGPWAVWLWVAT